MHLHAQDRFTVRNYNESSGLSNNFTEAITQEESGQLIIATRDGLNAYDGLGFKKIKADSTDLENVTSLKRGRHEICFGQFDGKIGERSSSGKTLLQKTALNDPVKELLIDDLKDVWVFSRSGKVLWIHDTDTALFNLFEEEVLINTVILFKQKEFIVGCNDGIWHVRFEAGKGFKILGKIEGVLDTKITALKYQRRNHILWVGTEDAGFYKVRLPFNNLQKIEEFKIPATGRIENVQTIFIDSRQNLWLGTFGSGLFRIENFDSYDKPVVVNRFENKIDNEHLIRDVFEDAEGNIWVATYGRGVIQIIEKVFQQLFDQTWLKKQSITKLFKDSQGNVWGGLENGLFKKSNSAHELQYQYYPLGGNKVTAFSEDRGGKIIVGTASNGLYTIDRNSKNFKKLPLPTDNLSQSINSISVTKKGINVCTNAGLYTINSKGKIMRHLNTLDGLPHNNVKFSYLDSTGRLWIANQANKVSYYWENKIHFIESESNQLITDVNHILQDSKGRLWFATLGNGIFVLGTDSAHSISKQNGLPSNFCYELALDNDGNIWVGHQKAISRINKQLVVDRVIGQNLISPNNNSVNSSIFRDDEGNIWITSNDNVIKFNPEIDKASMSIPKLSITGMQIFNKEQLMTENLVLPFNNYNIKFQILGISLRNPEKIRYKYRLDGYSSYWSDEQASNVIYFPKLENGSYTLEVIASKNGGEWTPVPVVYSFTIKPPFWRTPMFFVAIILGFSLVLTGFVRYRTYRLTADNEELEAVVAERTTEIQKQKQEIERSRDAISSYAKDITDSIRYAKRIQKAIFPAFKDIKNLLPESFVLFQSKDLVSGDFYYAKKIENKILFAAVDCTGHGVPGGFMSIVANNLLQQATNQMGLTKPSEILEYLNIGVTRTLHQTYEDSSVKDGMDIALCTLDPETKILEFAGAYNPLYLFRNNQLIEYKGNRFPVGNYVEEKIRQFTNHVIQLQKGDVLYIFSDGFADQFGGPDGKKLKLRNFKSMLHDLQKHPMDQQYEVVKTFLSNWMGEIEQIDDIVLIGVKIT
ncbi:two-component regulator propeller domain-containing protein [Bacteroidota bacterium]